MGLDTLNFAQQLITKCIPVNVQRLQNSHIETLLSTAKTSFAACINHHLLQCFNQYFKHCKSNTITHLITPLHTQYYILCLSKETDQHLMLGPFLDSTFNDSNIYTVINNLQLTVEHASDLKLYYHAIPIFDIGTLSDILTTINISVTQNTPTLYTLDLSKPLKTTTSYDLFTEHMNRTTSYKLLQERYIAEENLLTSISKGDMANAKICWTTILSHSEQVVRIQDSMRNTKNLIVSLNTLFRKAAQTGGVDPIYLDELSGKWATRIEQATNIETLENMPYRMIRAYCMLVKNHSLSQYSPIVQQALTYIHLNIASSLAVKDVAFEIGISADYLTRLFKNELGIPVISYINNKRIEASVKLLNTTDLNIQEIGELIGLSNTSYFDKLFKKHIGMSPKKYREHLKIL